MSKKEKKINIRRVWKIDPATKVEQDDTKDYNRSQTKREWLDELNEELTQLDDLEDFPE
jgi:hypothetical protein